ncbi:hypothetical protein NT05LM_1850 [Listeria marthii FSL S4-120]|uniref:Uncharacterized protein n=1 Tax=Listeria marthii FSL S4-120 TaxID=702457 RepID=A0ABN0BWV9_9LIST|nr:hypothetical protein NT05LM_1850 [Listeria marthii FSL S4-120]
MKKGQMKSSNRTLFLSISLIKSHFEHRSIPIIPKNGFIA